MKLRALLLGTAAAMALAAPALADDASVEQRLERLEKRIEVQDAQIQQQQDELRQMRGRVGRKGGAAPTAAAAAEAPPESTAQPQVTTAQFEALQNQVYESQAAQRSSAQVTFKGARPTISSSDGKWTFSPRVDVMGDFASYSKDHLFATATSAGMPIRSSGENFRRAQIGFEGKFAGDFAYKFMYDFGGTNGDETYQAFTNTSGTLSTTGAGSGPHVKEAWVSYTGALTPFTFQVGALPPPANLGDATSSDDLLFNERPSGSQLSRSLGGDDGREAVGIKGNGEIWNASLFLTGDTYGKGALIAPSDGQEGVVARVAIAPWQDPDSNFNVHFGVNGTEVFHPQQSTNSSAVTGTPITFSDRPELRVDNITLISTGGVSAKSAYTFGLEGAISYGAFLLQAENFWYGIARSGAAAGVSDPKFNAWYVEGSYVLTGEPRKYSMAAGAFTRPSAAYPFDPSKGQWGAWELAGRYSEADLDYHTSSLIAGDAVAGGDQRIWSAGVNFYPNDILKFMFDWQDVDVTHPAVPLLAVGETKAKYNTFSVRTQVTF